MTPSALLSRYGRMAPDGGFGLAQPGSLAHFPHSQWREHFRHSRHRPGRTQLQFSGSTFRRRQHVQFITHLRPPAERDRAEGARSVELQTTKAPAEPGLHLFVDTGLEECRYLEHGAHWGIGALAVIMLAGMRVDVPELVTGLVGVTLIGLSFLSSVRYRRSPHAE